MIITNIQTNNILGTLTFCRTCKIDAIYKKKIDGN